MVFHKLEGLGNDFVLFSEFDQLDFDFSKFRAVAPKLCDRRKGIGADGLLLLSQGDKADFTLKIINSDGSEAENCGNGLRCAALFARMKNLTSKKHFTIEPPAGIIPIEILDNEEIKVKLGKARFDRAAIPVTGSPASELFGEKVRVENRDFELHAVNVGNPHCVIFTPLSYSEVCRFGPQVETHPLFPRKINVEFVEVVDRKNLKVQVWERGAGYTMACGTGATAVAATAHKKGLIDLPTKIELPGGVLTIEREEEDFFLTGPANLVFQGEINI